MTPDDPEPLVQRLTGTVRRQVGHYFQHLSIVIHVFVDDDDIEATIFFRATDISSRTELFDAPEDRITTEVATASRLEQNDTEVQHGTNKMKQKASCRRTDAGPVDCQQCLDEELLRLEDEINDEQKSEVLRSVLKVLEDGGSAGVTKTQLQVRTLGEWSTDTS